MSAAQADITWKGTISEGQKSQFALTDTANGASKWVKLGGSFESYSVSQYDEQKQVLTLTKDGGSLQLSMASSQYTPPPVAPANDDLRSMSDFRLAQTLADRGDPTLQALLAEHRDYILNRSEVMRTLAAGERKINAGASDAPSPVAMKSYRADLNRWNKEVSRIESEIRVAADSRRRAILSGAAP